MSNQNQISQSQKLTGKPSMIINKKYWYLIRAGLTACFSFCVQFVFCQTLQTVTDKKDILIGEQIKLTIKANSPLNLRFVLPDSLPHFDIVETSQPDSNLKKDNSEQTLVITSFDSGRWVFPRLPVQISSPGGSPDIVQTDSFFVNVGYAPADSTNQLRDIKPIISVSVFDYFWLYIAGGILVLLLTCFLLYRYFKTSKKAAPATTTSKLSAFDEAMAELKNLSHFNLQEAAEIKQYHIKLAYIFKNYLDRKQGKNLLSKTTGDLLINMKEVNLPAENMSELATALRCTDAVKFAKYLPLPDQSEDAQQKIKETIILIESPKPLNPKPLN